MTTQGRQKLPRFSLTMMVVGPMAGPGKFALPRTFGGATDPFGATIASCIASGGMSMLMRIFQLLAEKRPDIEPSVLSQLHSCLGKVKSLQVKEWSGFVWQELTGAVEGVSGILIFFNPLKGALAMVRHLESGCAGGECSARPEAAPHQHFAPCRRRRLRRHCSHHAQGAAMKTLRDRPPPYGSIGVRR